MLKLMCFLALFIPVAAFSNAIKIKDGLYYGYWVYKDRGVLKEYGVLANNPKKENGEYILTPTPKYTADDEIYMQVKGSKSVVYFYHANVVSDFNTIGWADVKINSNNISIGENTIRMVTDDTKERVAVGGKFSGKIVKLESDEIVPFKVINDDIFEVDCNQYLKANGYRENGIPYYDEPDPQGREGSGDAYTATVFVHDELGICATFLDDGVVREIKKGWIQFRRLN